MTRNPIRRLIRNEIVRILCMERHPSNYRPRRVHVPLKTEQPGNTPTRATTGSAGYDLRSTSAADIAPGDRKIIGTGVKMAIPYGHVGLVSIRSGMALKRGLDLANGIGIIDSDYRGEIMIPVRNCTDKIVSIREGERIAQITILPLSPTELSTSMDIQETPRGSGGFGSTGV